MRLMLVGDAKVYARQAGSGDLIAGFEVQDDVVLMAAGIVVTGSGIGLGFLEEQGKISGIETCVFADRLYLGGLGRGG